MRIARGLVLGLALAASLAGCGDSGGDSNVASAGKGPKASTSASAGTGKVDQASMQKYAQCMREHGLPDFADPEVESDGKVRMVLPQTGSGETVDKTVIDAANAACRQYMPNGGEPPKLDPKELEELRKYAQCMRENGVPDFPDPNTDGSGVQMGTDNGTGNAMDPDSPTFKAADKTCEKNRPGSAQHQSDGGGK